VEKTIGAWAGLAIAMAGVLVPASALGQTPTGVIEGGVTDSAGGVLANATVLVREADTNQARTVMTDDAGSFRLTQLPVGAYRIRVTFPGFADFTRDGIVLMIGQTLHLTIALLPAGVTEAVGVSAQPPPLDTHQTAVTTTVDTERIEELPVQSRDYLHFVQLAPGVVSVPPPATAQTASVLPDSGFSFAGLRPRSNRLTIDGLDNNDQYSGASRTELSLEIVREFQVVTNGYAAENGGASGGAINVVTKSGTNRIQGDAFVFGESGTLDAPPPLEETLGVKPDVTRFRGGFSIGGPVVTDRSFFYTAIEREQMHGQAASDIDPQTAATINAHVPPGLPRLTTGLFPTALIETEWSGKVNHAVTPRHFLMVRVAGTNRTDTADAFNTGGLSDMSARGSDATRDTTLSATWTSVVGTRATNDVRGQLATRRVALSTADTHGPGISIAGVADFGRPYAGNDVHNQRYLEIGDTVSWTRGAHFFKTGFDVTNVALTGTRTAGMGGLFEFPSLDAFVAGHPDRFRQVFGQPAVDVSTTLTGTFVQDHWTPVSPLTIDAGVRLDIETVPASLNVTDRQWSPRVGLAWSLAPTWVMRGGIGRFADRLVLAAFEPALLIDGHHGVEQVVGGAGASAVVNTTNGGGFTGPLPGVAPSIYAVQTGHWQPSSRQASIGVEHQLNPNLTASVNVLFVQGQNLPRSVNVNLPPPTMLTLANAAAIGVLDPTPQQLARPVFGPARLNPAFDGIYQVQPTASSTYHGVTVLLNRRLASDLEWSTAYTWSHAADTASDFDEQPQNPYDMNAELATSRYDQRHRFVTSALFDLPIGDEEDRRPGEMPPFWTRVFSNIELAPILTMESGRSVNPITGADSAQTHAFPLTTRPLGFARNSLRLPASATLDLRVLKFFPIKPHGKLDVVVEAFNLLNRVNVTALNTVYGPLGTPLPTFGQPSDGNAPRRIQFSIDFEY
jgi:hypothetical protein